MDTLLVGLVMVVGLVGVVVPVLPGTALVLAAGVGWAALVVEGGTARWVVVGVMAALFVAGLVLKVALPGRRLSGRAPALDAAADRGRGGVGLRRAAPARAAARRGRRDLRRRGPRLGPGAPGRASTVRVLKAVGLGVLAELTAAVLMVGTWLVGLAVT
jgi:hypothetical protein